MVQAQPGPLGSGVSRVTLVTVRGPWPQSSIYKVTLVAALDGPGASGRRLSSLKGDGGQASPKVW